MGVIQGKTQKVFFFTLCHFRITVYCVPSAVLICCHTALVTYSSNRHEWKFPTQNVNYVSFKKEKQNNGAKEKEQQEMRDLTTKGT